MFKRVLIASALAAAFAVPAMAEVAISGSAEMDLMVGTNRAEGNSSGTQLYEEIAITINVDGKDKLDNGDTLSWRLAQKVATDWKYDSWGAREAWIGYEGSWGNLRFGNQFTDTYLTLDWPYGVNGSGNMTADQGTLAVWTGRDGFGGSIRYATPSFSGVGLTAQYIIGSYAADGSNADGWDLGLNGSWGGFNLNAGYQVLNNRAHTQQSFGGDTASWLNVKGSQNETELYFVGARYNFGDFNLRGLYKHNSVTLNNVEAEADQWLIGGGYSFGKNSITVSYQQLMDADVSGGANPGSRNSGAQQIAGQWNYSISKNSVFFVQGRYHMYDSTSNDVGGNYSPRYDGSVASKDNSFRLTVGTWTGF
ncbi:porin [Chitinilyticum aquatile]|uniref:porin n=1 Tax=Chitinilyticum aquatile TaxID=362520 RepID=UPI00040800DA|nr:porin [Chitinilyticum aquatile]